MKHLCDDCVHDFPTCDSSAVLWGIDVNPEAVGAEADTVIECKSYQSNMNKCNDGNIPTECYGCKESDLCK